MDRFKFDLKFINGNPVIETNECEDGAWVVFLDHKNAVDKLTDELVNTEARLNLLLDKTEAPNPPSTDLAWAEVKNRKAIELGHEIRLPLCLEVFLEILDFGHTYGVSSEANRAEVLVKALEQIDNTSDCKFALEIVDEALSTYRNGAANE